MNNDELRELIALMEASDLTALELTRPGFKVRLEVAREAAHSRSRQTWNAAETGAARGSEGSHAASATTLVTAPHFGIFSTRHPARQEAFGEEGKQVACGDTLGVLRINEIYVPVLSPAAGRLHCLVDDGVLIGYATPLFEIVAA